jgi:hypothetical protein
MKFEIGQQVRNKNTGKIGTVKQWKVEGYILLGKQVELIQYQIQNEGSYYNELVKEDLLEPAEDFTNKIELFLIGSLIDTYLDFKRLDSVKELYEQKQKYLG